MYLTAESPAQVARLAEPALRAGDGRSMIPFKYTLAKEIHATEATIAYAGYRNDDNAPITLKIPNSECPSPRQVARLRHEHAILATLPLPGVLRTIAIEAWDQGIALILEPFDGQPLDRLARARRLGPKEIIELAIPVAEALDAVHRRGIVHRDIRPRNILVGTAHDRIKLTDFGIAVRHPARPHTHEEARAETSQLEPHERPNADPPGADSKLLEGTLAYMSPEQTGRVEREVDRRADLYSLGVTLYELLTSMLPFRATDPVELIHSHTARTATPPHELSPGVPRVISDVVMRLLAKSPEDRYQTAYGLKVDLEECLTRWDTTGGLAPFPLGQRDRSEALRIPRRLHGREPELAALLAAVERTADGAAELVLLVGDTGIGKSALVGELQRAVLRARRGVLFAAGRFDHASRQPPSGPVMQPLRELCRQLLTEPADVLASWKQRLITALGANGQVLADFIPELSFVVGPQPAYPELGPLESQSRLRQVFQDVVWAFAAREHPLVLFFDDLQWADAAELGLIQALLTTADPRCAHLLVIGAARGAAVDGARDIAPERQPSLPLAALAFGAASTLELGALAVADATDLIAEALACDPDRAAPLAALVHAKTGGNPLYLGQFLQTMRAEGALAFDVRTDAWAWEMAKVNAVPITDNLLSLLEEKIHRLSPAAQREVAIAACIGRELDLATLSLLVECPAALLQEAQEAGLLVAVEAAGSEAMEGGKGATRALRFVHDRVRSAAVASLAEPEREAVHLRLGRLVQERWRSERSDAARLQALVHLNLGAPQITDPHERAELARMNLAAGRSAKIRADYPAALRFFEAGIAALPAESFEREHELSFLLHTEAAESAYLTGQLGRAEALANALLSRAHTDLDRAQIHGLQVTLYLAQGRLDDALRVGRAGLSLFDIDLPEDEPNRKAAADAELTAVRAALGKRRLSDLLDAPEMSDDPARAALDLLGSLTMPALLTSRSLATFVAAKQVNLSLAQGHSSASAYGYMAYGAVEARWSRKYEEAYDLGMFALDLSARFSDTALSCRLHFMFGAHISSFKKHLLSSLDHFAQAHEAGLQIGDLTYLSHTAIHTLLVRIGLGDECESVRAAVDEALALSPRAKDEKRSRTSFAPSSTSRAGARRSRIST